MKHSKTSFVFGLSSSIQRCCWILVGSIQEYHFLSIQSEIEMINGPNIFSNPIIYYFSSLLYQSMPYSVYPSTDHIELN